MAQRVWKEDNNNIPKVLKTYFLRLFGHEGWMIVEGVVQKLFSPIFGVHVLF